MLVLGLCRTNFQPWFYCQLSTCWLSTAKTWKYIWMSHPSLSFWSWASRSHLFQKTTESPAFFSSAHRLQFSTLTLSCYTTVSLATRSDHFSFHFTFNFVFNPWDLYTRRYKKIIIIIRQFTRHHNMSAKSLQGCRTAYDTPIKLIKSPATKYDCRNKWVLRRFLKVDSIDAF